MVFHGFWLVSMVFQGGFMVFHGFWLVLGWFSWFFMVPDWFFMVFNGSRLVFHGFSPKCNPPNSILAQRSSLGPLPGGRHRT